MLETPSYIRNYIKTLESTKVTLLFKLLATNSVSQVSDLYRYRSTSRVPVQSTLNFSFIVFHQLPYRQQNLIRSYLIQRQSIYFRFYIKLFYTEILSIKKGNNND